MPGHPVVAYMTQTGMSVHRADCKSFAKSNPDPERIHGAHWEGDQEYQCSLRVVLGARPNALADLTSAMRPINVDIVHAEYGPGTNGFSHFDFTFETSDQSQFGRIERALRTVAGVTDVVLQPEEVVPFPKTG